MNEAEKERNKVRAQPAASQRKRRDTQAVPQHVGRFLSRVVSELERARGLHPDSRVGLGMALMEEAGEVAKALMHHRWEPEKDDAPPPAVRDELVQVATMALRLYLEGDEHYHFLGVETAGSGMCTCVGEVVERAIGSEDPGCWVHTVEP